MVNIEDGPTAYNHASHWVSRIIDAEWPFKISNPVLASVIWFGALPNSTFIIYSYARGGQMPSYVLLAISFGILWLNVGPALIWYYDERVLPNFFRQLSTLLSDDVRVKELNKKYDNIFSNWYWVLSLFTTGILVLLFVRYQAQVIEIGMADSGGIFFYWLLVMGLWLGVLVGVGFTGVVTTLLVIYELASEPLNISPLHPDGLGGLSIVGYYAIRTTITFSSGSILLPLLFIFIRQGSSNSIIYFTVFCYMSAIALSFLYPTFKINRQARRMRNENLEELRQKYEQAKREMNSTDDPVAESTYIPEPDAAHSQPDKTDESGLGELVSQLELQRIRQDYEDYKNVNLYPFKIDIMFRLFSSVLLPVLFLVVDQVLYYNYQTLLGL